MKPSINLKGVVVSVLSHDEAMDELAAQLDEHDNTRVVFSLDDESVTPSVTELVAQDCRYDPREGVIRVTLIKG